MIRADLITSVVLMALGLATAFESWRMPRFTEFQASIWAAPGIVPGMLGVALVVLGFILHLRTIFARRTGGAEEHASEPGGWRRVGLALALCITYAGILVSQIPFWLATFIFVLAFILVFELSHADARQHWLRRAVVAALAAAVTSAAVSYVFQEIFFVRLP